jgi:hypothetical protein
LHRRKRGGGEQHEAEVCHDGFIPRRKVLSPHGTAMAINSQPLGRIVAAGVFYFNIAMT